MSRLDYIESLYRLDDVYQQNNFSDDNISQLVKLVEAKVPVADKIKPTRRYAIEAETTDIDWVSVAFNTAIAANPYAPPLARLRSGLKVAEELAFIDNRPLNAVDALERLDIV